MEFGGGGLAGSAISVSAAAVGGGTRGSFSGAGGNPTTTTSSSSLSNGVAVASGLSSISFDYTGHGATPAPRQSSPVSNNRYVFFFCVVMTKN